MSLPPDSDEAARTSKLILGILYALAKRTQGKFSIALVEFPTAKFDLRITNADGRVTVEIARENISPLN